MSRGGTTACWPAYEITWYDLGLSYDVPRELTAKVERTIRSDLSARRPRRVNLYHAPGSGGTTVSRRVLWNLRHEFPCLFLRRTKPAETTERLAYIASLTGKPILLAVDAGAITDREADALYERVAAAHIPVILFQVIRRRSRPDEQRRALYLDSELEGVEAERFVHFLPSRRVVQSNSIFAAANRIGPGCSRAEGIGSRRFVNQPLQRRSYTFAFAV